MRKNGYIFRVAIVGGVDGCSGGWIAVIQDQSSGAISSISVRQIDELPPLDLIAIDIPIGLTENRSRACDIEARKLLGQRASCVFPAPIMPALNARTRQEASDISTSLTGKGVPAQSFALYAKIRSVRGWASSSPGYRDKVFEIHPEISFLALSGDDPVKHPKRSLSGAQERLQLVETYFGPGSFEAVRKKDRRSVADDDILDAFAALWSAHRIWNGKSDVCGPDGVDGEGFKIGIWY